MVGISWKRLTEIAIITAVAIGATAAEARTYHHYRGVPSAHRGATSYTPPSYAPPPVYAYTAPPSTGFRGGYRYRNDWQLQGRTGYGNGLSTNGLVENRVGDNNSGTNRALASDSISLGSAELVGVELSAKSLDIQGTRR
jgi:hypothetical protein